MTPGLAEPCNLLLDFDRLVILPNCLHLPCVRFRVFCVAFHQSQQRNLTALRVISRARERRFGHPFEQIVILGAQAPKSLERLLRFASSVVEVVGPTILIIGHDQRVLLRQDLPESMGADQFRIGHVGHELPDTPFPTRTVRPRRNKILLFAKNARKDHGEQFRTATESFEECWNIGHAGDQL